MFDITVSPAQEEEAGQESHAVHRPATPVTPPLLRRKEQEYTNGTAKTCKHVQSAPYRHSALAPAPGNQ